MKIIVGMSGGVDSSVTALLLQQQGYEVEGLFMKNWEEDDTTSYCPASIELASAQAVCDKLQIRLHTINFAAEYWDHVFEHFLAEYAAGRTPNPDILCNKEIKFKAFLDYAHTLGAECIATGHYAKKIQHNNEFQLLKAADLNKDQSYFLYTLNQQQLAHSIFPLGDITKPAVRKLALQAGFPNHNKKDSTGICFIGERKFKAFLEQYLPHQAGPIATTDGKVVGHHDGLMYYTLGQRKGIGIGGIKGQTEAPWYVVAKDLASNTLIVGQGHDHPRLFTHQLIADQLHWTNSTAPGNHYLCAAKTRYRQVEQACELIQQPDQTLLVRFTEPHWAATPGQAIVFYQGQQCLGGGTIASIGV